MAIRMDYNRGITKEVRAEETVASNDPVVVGGLVGVALTNALEGDGGDFWVTVAFQGVLSTVGDDVIASGAVDQGTPIYADTAADADGIAVTTGLTTDADDGESSPTEYKLFGYTLNTRVGNTGNLEIKVVN